MKFEEGLFPPEPSDFPVGMESMVEWEQKLVEKTRNDQEIAMRELMNYGLAHMDIPPFNCQSPMMVTMMKKLCNIPSNFRSLSINDCTPIENLFIPAEE